MKIRRLETDIQKKYELDRQTYRLTEGETETKIAKAAK